MGVELRGVREALEQPERMRSRPLRVVLVVGGVGAGSEHLDDELLLRRTRTRTAVRRGGKAERGALDRPARFLDGLQRAARRDGRVREEGEGHEVPGLA